MTNRCSYAEFAGCPTVVVRREGQPTDQLHTLMDSAFIALNQAINDHHFTPVGPAVARYDSEFGHTVDVEVGFPVGEPLTEQLTYNGETVMGSELPAGQLARTTHVGPYENLGASWGALTEAALADGWSVATPYWESYRTMPTPATDAASLETDLAVVVTKS